MNTPRMKRAASLALLLLLSCAGAARAQNAPPPPAPTPAPREDGARHADRAEAAAGFISGRVLVDGGEPLAGAVVFALPRNSFAPGSSRRTATTDEEGTFRLTGIEPGVYNIGVTAAGYVSEADPQTGRAPGPYRAGDTVTMRMTRGGVITGKVLGQRGEPLVAIPVRTFRVRDFEGRPAPGTFYTEDKTDDRGVYRIYGLAPGVYTVMAGGSRQFGGPFPSIFDRDVPTFYPSSTRDTAVEIAVRAGQELAGIDIRHREEQGHRVTGAVEVPPTIQSAEGSISVTLSYAAGGPPAGNSFIPLNSEARSFSVEGIADGDYEVQAMVSARAGLLGASPPQRVAVRGADVTGLKVSVTALAFITGKLVVEPAALADRARPDCKDLPASTPPQEVLVSARADRPAGERPAAGPRAFRSSDATPDAEGSFTLRNLEAGRYQLSALPLDDRFYVRAVQLPPQAPQAPRGGAQVAGRDATGDVVSLAAGQQLSGVTVRLAAGAAFLGGTVAGREGAPPPSWSAQSRVYLVPAERERADDPLHYAEVTLAADGSFAFKNLAPGRYRLLAREAGAEPAGPSARAVFRDAAGRAQLRRDAEASGTPVELQPCQRTADFSLRLQ